jgi:DNA-binding LacI/PurR family transcriptional regulator
VKARQGAELGEEGPGAMRRVTSFDIAERARVSQPTVSRALSGNPSVSAETRARVFAAAEALGYKVDKNASNLRRQATRTLALLFFEDPAPGDSSINPFFLSMLGAITKASAAAGYDLLISFQQLSGNWHLDYEDARKADGLILLGYGDYLAYRPRLEQLMAQGTHFVRWGSLRTGGIGPTIGSDNAGGGALAARHLMERGRRRIAFIGTAAAGSPEFLDRHDGWRAALQAAGVAVDPALVRAAASSEADGLAATRALIADGADFDAIFCASDLIAIGAMRALAEAGRRVPDDVAVVGFDDQPAASLTSPPLTTVAQDARRAGDVLVATLLAQLRGEVTPPMALPTRLVVRGTS